MERHSRHKKAFAESILNKIEETRHPDDIVAICQYISKLAVENRDKVAEAPVPIMYIGLDLRVLNNCENAGKIPELLKAWSSPAFYTKEDKDLVLNVFDAVHEDFTKAFPNYVFRNTVEGSKKEAEKREERVRARREKKKMGRAIEARGARRRARVCAQVHRR